MINEIYKEFTVGTREAEHFKYTGFNIHQQDKQILVDQQEYIKKLKIQEQTGKKPKDQALSEKKLSMLRSNVGQVICSAGDLQFLHLNNILISIPISPKIPINQCRY